MKMEIRIANSLEVKMLANGGRWCEIVMKKTGEKLKVVRTGYGSFENVISDSANLVDMSGNVIVSGNSLYEIADYITKKYC